jgi:hypothetical protein
VIKTIEIISGSARGGESAYVMLDKISIFEHVGHVVFPNPSMDINFEKEKPAPGRSGAG